jgi:hypothetical protein
VETFENVFNYLAQPELFIGLSTLAFILLVWKIRFITRPALMSVIIVLTALFFVIGAQHHDFLLIITKGDNMPIVIMIFALLACLYVGLRQAAVNDMRMERGEPPKEALESNKKVLVWPDLVFPEFICTVVLSAAFIVWGILVEAPIEEPASGTRAPNPAKAPWYFLGLQEMLVYYDPWFAGVLLPTFIVLGLMAIPYIDVNPRGNGYYTFKERKFAISMYLFGFLVLWVALIILGTFLRGPNWNFFGPFEYWDPHKVEPLVNVNLSEFVWVRWLDTRLPDSILLREAPGFVLLLAYFVIMPGLLAKTALRKFFDQMGFARYSVMVGLLLFMAMLPIKMLLRWTFNLKYLIAIPEYFFNI